MGYTVPPAPLQSPTMYAGVPQPRGWHRNQMTVLPPPPHGGLSANTCVLLDACGCCSEAFGYLGFGEMCKRQCPPPPPPTCKEGDYSRGWRGGTSGLRCHVSCMTCLLVEVCCSFGGGGGGGVT